MIEWEIDELICKVCGKSDEETNRIIDNGEIDDLIYEKYGIEAQTYYDIVKDLLPFTLPVKMALGGLARGFVDGKFFIVKQEIKESEA